MPLVTVLVTDAKADIAGDVREMRRRQVRVAQHHIEPRCPRNKAISSSFRCRRRAFARLGFVGKQVTGSTSTSTRPAECA
jgi:hypothetical protein